MSNTSQIFNEFVQTDTTMNRSTTPPPLFYLLTPPPSGGFDKRGAFVETNIVEHVSKRLSKVKETESPAAFFEGQDEASDAELAELSEGDSSSATYDTAPASPVSDLSTASQTNITNKHNLLVSTTSVQTPVPTEPFAFFRLPLSIRKRIYQHLLVIPALICIRQNQSSSSDAHTLSSDHHLLPGIFSTPACLAINGSTSPFSRFAHTNISILLANKEVHAEAKPILYSLNAFAIRKPSAELSPPTDFSVRLFPPGCQRLVKQLYTRIRSFYDLAWLLSGGYNDIKNFYRGVGTLTLILELDSVRKGFGKQWARREGEEWKVYVQRLLSEIVRDVDAGSKAKTKKDAKGKEKKKIVPAWIMLRVMFGGETYDEKLEDAGAESIEQGKRDGLRQALTEAWELFRKGSR
jgi:hypothetical protein